MSQQLVRRAAAVGVASALGQALTNGGSEVKLEAAEVQDVHRIIARSQTIPAGLLSVGAKVAGNPKVQAAVFDALWEDYTLVDVPGGAPIPVLRAEADGKECWSAGGEEGEEEGGEQRQAEEGNEGKAQSLSSSSSAPSSLSNLRQRRGKNNKLAPIGAQSRQQQQQQQQQDQPVEDQEAVFEQAERRMRDWKCVRQPSTDSQLSSTSTSSLPAQHSARSENVADIVTPVDDAASVVTPLPPIELDSPPHSVAAAVAPQPPQQTGMLEWLMQWLDSTIGGIFGVLLPTPATSSTSTSSSSSSSSSLTSAPSSQSTTEASYRLVASDAADSTASVSATSASLSAPLSSSSAALESLARGAKVVGSVATVIIVLALVRRHSPALFAMVAKLLH